MTGFDDEFLRRIDGRHFLLGGEDGHTPVKCSLLEWSHWFGKNDDKRVVGHTDLELVFVSTVFLGLDHNYWGKGPPVLFETMVFAKETHAVDIKGESFEAHEDFDQIRYSSWDDAAAGHEACVRRWRKREADARLVQIRKKLNQQDDNGGGR